MASIARNGDRVFQVTPSEWVDLPSVDSARSQESRDEAAVLDTSDLHVLASKIASRVSEMRAAHFFIQNECAGTIQAQTGEQLLGIFDEAEEAADAFEADMLKAIAKLRREIGNARRATLTAMPNRRQPLHSPLSGRTAFLELAPSHLAPLSAGNLALNAHDTVDDFHQESPGLHINPEHSPLSAQISPVPAPISFNRVMMVHMDAAAAAVKYATAASIVPSQKQKSASLQNAIQKATEEAFAQRLKTLVIDPFLSKQSLRFESAKRGADIGTTCMQLLEKDENAQKLDTIIIAIPSDKSERVFSSIAQGIAGHAKAMVLDKKGDRLQLEAAVLPPAREDLESQPVVSAVPDDDRPLPTKPSSFEALFDAAIKRPARPKSRPAASRTVVTSAGLETRPNASVVNVPSGDDRPLPAVVANQSCVIEKAPASAKRKAEEKAASASKEELLPEARHGSKSAASRATVAPAKRPLSAAMSKSSVRQARTPATQEKAIPVGSDKTTSKVVTQ